MEAASLIIGNGNWGTKPSELLGYYVENGNQYRPLIGDVSRSSTKMVTNKDGLLEKVNPNIASIDYSDDVKGSLLLEPQSTNLITYSEDFNSGVWKRQSGTISDGGVGLFYLRPLSSVIKYESTSTGYNQLYSQISTSTVIGNDYTEFFYIKTTGVPFIHVQVQALGNDSVLVIDVDNSSIFSTTGITNVSVDFLNDDWIKIKYSYEALLVKSLFTKCYLSSTSSFYGDGVPIGSEAYITTVQLEALPYATSYIPTSGSAVTRVQDYFHNFGDVNTFNSEEGVLSIEMAALGEGFNRYISLSDGTNTNRLILRYTSSNASISTYVVVGGNVITYISSTVSDITKSSKVAFSYKENNYSLYINGVKVAEQLSGITFPPNTLNKLSFANSNGSYFSFFGKVKELQVYKESLTDSELITLTTI